MVDETMEGEITDEADYYCITLKSAFQNSLSSQSSSHPEERELPPPKCPYVPDEPFKL